MRHDHQRLAGLVRQAEQQVQHLRAVLPVQVPGGFIRKNDGGVIRQGAGDRHALLLPAAQLAGQMVQAVGEAHALHQLRHVFHARPPADGGGQASVFQRRQLRHQQVILENEPHVPVPEYGPRRGGQGVNIRAVNRHGPLLGRFQPGQRVHQRGLSGSAGAAQEHLFPGGDVQVHPVQNLNGLLADGIAAVEVGGGNHGRSIRESVRD